MGNHGVFSRRAGAFAAGQHFILQAAFSHLDAFLLGMGRAVGSTSSQVLIGFACHLGLLFFHLLLLECSDRSVHIFGRHQRLGLLLAHCASAHTCQEALQINAIHAALHLLTGAITE